jgi:NitT/TauT family transport system substrate-binding protein
MSATLGQKPSGMTSRGKLILIFIVIGALIGGYFMFKGKIQEAVGTVASGDVIRVGVVTWPGYIGGEYMNNGFAPTTECRFFKDYGIQVEFKLIDDFLASRKAFENGEVDLLWCTVDALPTEMGSKGTMVAQVPKFFFQADWSRGGDAIVARMGIETVADMKGKTVAVAQGTPSHSFLIDLLKTNGLTLQDVKVQYVASAVDAANLFKQQAVDLAVVWSPDDADCVSKVSGSKILSSTKTATNIIADGFIVKETYLLANLEKLQKLYDGWMVGNMEINTNKDNAKKVAANILATRFQMKESDALAAMTTVRLTTHGDNLNFFGLGDSKAVTGDALYSKMAGVYTQLSMVEAPISWRDASYSNIVKSSTLTGGGHGAEPQAAFSAITSDLVTKQAFSNKKVTINFNTGAYELSGDAKYTINKEFGDVIKTYQGARIRVEGNTDNTGNAKANKTLSEKRAQSVKDYLIAEYGVDPNRIIVVGNGPKHAIDAGVNGASEEYRRTDFQLVE